MVARKFTLRKMNSVQLLNSPFRFFIYLIASPKSSEQHKIKLCTKKVLPKKRLCKLVKFVWTGIQYSYFKVCRIKLCHFRLIFFKSRGSFLLFWLCFILILGLGKFEKPFLYKSPIPSNTRYSMIC